MKKTFCLLSTIISKIFPTFLLLSSIFYISKRSFSLSVFLIYWLNMWRHGSTTVDISIWKTSCNKWKTTTKFLLVWRYSCWKLLLFTLQNSHMFLLLQGRNQSCGMRLYKKNFFQWLKFSTKSCKPQLVRHLWNVFSRSFLRILRVEWGAT